jgi:hypothetical protein
MIEAMMAQWLCSSVGTLAQAGAGPDRELCVNRGGTEVAVEACMTFDPRPPLRVCDACARHVFATETRCPFCAAVLVPVAVRPRFKLSSQLSRAQRFALAGAFAGLIGCSDSHAPVQTQAIYGAPVPPGGNGPSGIGPAGVAGSTVPGQPNTGGTGTGGIGGTGGGGGIIGIIMPMYGGPPTISNDMDAGDAKGDDAGDDDGGQK